nr:UDP-N-acetylglucosamine 2-epimerase (non-hydrolyzing) [Legionellales bacterium]
QEKQNLLNERNASSEIVVTGNTVIDALYQIASRDIPLPIHVTADQKLLLVTCHRRESFGEPLTHVCKALLQIAHDNPQVLIVYPVHPNPHVTKKVYSLLNDCPSIQLLPPQPYDQFVNLMKHAYLVLTDSGGVQEEAPALAKPVLVLRDKTERPEIIRQGLGQVIGTDPQHVTQVTTQLLQHPEHYQAMAQGFSPYGDGQASQRIVEALLNFYGR